MRLSKGINLFTRALLLGSAVVVSEEVRFMFDKTSTMYQTLSFLFLIVLVGVGYWTGRIHEREDREKI